MISIFLVVQVIVHWFSHLSSKEKKVLKRTIISLVIASAIIGIVVPLVYLFAFPSTPSKCKCILSKEYNVVDIPLRTSLASSGNTNISTCSTSTCIGQETSYRSSIATTFFPFDGNSDDQTGYISAFMMSPNIAAYIQGYLTEAVSFTIASPQYLQVLNIDLTRKSFTIQFWFFIQTFGPANDFGLFGQCDAYNVCLSISLRNTRVAISLDSMNVNNNTLIGATVITTNAFTHITVVYDSTISQLRIYFNGRLDAVSSGIVSAYQGNPASVVTTIGRGWSYGYSEGSYNA